MGAVVSATREVVYGVRELAKGTRSPKGAHDGPQGRLGRSGHNDMDLAVRRSDTPPMLTAIKSGRVASPASTTIRMNGAAFVQRSLAVVPAAKGGLHGWAVSISISKMAARSKGLSIKVSPAFMHTITRVRVALRLGVAATAVYT